MERADNRPTPSDMTLYRRYQGIRGTSNTPRSCTTAAIDSSEAQNHIDAREINAHKKLIFLFPCKYLYILSYERILLN